MRIYYIPVLLAISILPVAYLDQTGPTLLLVERRPSARVPLATEARPRLLMRTQPAPTILHNAPARETTTPSTPARSPNRFTRPLSRHEPRRHQLNKDNNLLHVESRTANLTEQDSEQELLCLVKVYMDTYVDHNLYNVGFVDMNDRLVFLVPLVIIYWHHRHPHRPVPYADIDGVLREIGGPEADGHRLVLKDVVKKLSGQQHYCSATRTPVPSSDGDYQRANQQRAAEALRILKEWLGDSEQLVEPDSEPAGSTDLNRQSSSGREIRNWFQALANLHRRPSNSNGSTTTTTRRPSYVTLDPSNFVSTTPTTTTITITTETLPPVASTSPTGEPFGMPHLENRTRVGQDRPTVPLMSMSNPNLMEQLKDIQSSLSVANATLEQQVRLNASHYGEFFELVSSIITEIDNIHNSTYLNGEHF